eukprot:COSAG05_NODE_138_length_16837_cov_344.961286_3_plen_66_part_00
MHARIISDRDFRTIHLKIIRSNDLISDELFSGDLGLVSFIETRQVRGSTRSYQHRAIASVVQACD